MRFFTLTAFLFSFTCSFNFVSAQLGGNLFSQDQVVDIHLNFANGNFWTSLISNYETGDYTPANLTITDFSGTSTINNIGVRIKGNSSFDHPGDKKALKLDFNEYVPGQNYDGLKKLNLHNSFNDPTLMREKLYFDICADAGVPAPRTSFANVYMNGTLWGFYTIVEQVDNQFLTENYVNSTGNLFKAGDNLLPNEAPADLVYYGPLQVTYENRYELKSNEVENDWTDLIDFIDFINNSNEAVFATGLNSRMEIIEYLRSLALDNLFSNLASYHGTAENYYLYNNPAKNKWHWIKWDGNESFGLFYNGLSDLESLPINYANPEDRPLVQNIFNNTILYNQYLSQVCYLKTNYFNSSYMNSRIDELRDLIQADVYADNNKQFSNTNFDTNIETDITVNSDQIIYGLKSFITNRVSYLAGQIDCNNCSYDIAGITGCTYPDSPNFNPLATVDDGSCTYCSGDFNGDGSITTSDLSGFLANFGTFCN